MGVPTKTFGLELWIEVRIDQGDCAGLVREGQEKRWEKCKPCQVLGHPLVPTKGWGNAGRENSNLNGDWAAGINNQVGNARAQPRDVLVPGGFSPTPSMGACLKRWQSSDFDIKPPQKKDFIPMPTSHPACSFSCTVWEEFLLHRWGMEPWRAGCAALRWAASFLLPCWVLSPQHSHLSDAPLGPERLF